MPKPACSATETTYEIETSSSGKFGYDTFQHVNKKGTDQTARMHKLVCDFVVSQTTEDRFSLIPCVSSVQSCRVTIYQEMFHFLL